VQTSHKQRQSKHVKSLLTICHEKTSILIFTQKCIETVQYWIGRYGNAVVLYP